MTPPQKLRAEALALAVAAAPDGANALFIIALASAFEDYLIAGHTCAALRPPATLQVVPK